MPTVPEERRRPAQPVHPTPNEASSAADVPPAEPGLRGLAQEIGRRSAAQTYECGWKDGARDAINECKRLGLITPEGIERAQVILDRLEADGA